MKLWKKGKANPSHWGIGHFTTSLFFLEERKSLNFPVSVTSFIFILRNLITFSTFPVMFLYCLEIFFFSALSPLDAMLDCQSLGSTCHICACWLLIISWHQKLCINLVCPIQCLPQSLRLMITWASCLKEWWLKSWFVYSNSRSRELLPSDFLWQWEETLALGPCWGTLAESIGTRYMII